LKNIKASELCVKEEMFVHIKCQFPVVKRLLHQFKFIEFLFPV